ncbi:MAG TPA: heme-binding protein [Alphaproteobacteria bacterium]|nr:heme-binding protein [Alphaproteobacteria bacterium]
MFRNPRKLARLPFASIPAAFAVCAVLSLFTQDAQAQLVERKALTLEAARKIVRAAEAEAARNNWPSVIAVVDEGGWPILIERMDNAALLAGVELAPGKARTAALFKRPSQALEDAINKGRTAAVTARGFIEMKGALPIVVDGQVVGAVGVSGETPDHDVQIAQAGLAALKE